MSKQQLPQRTKTFPFALLWMHSEFEFFTFLRSTPNKKLFNAKLFFLLAISHILYIYIFFYVYLTKTFIRFFYANKFLNNSSRHMRRMRDLTWTPLKVCSAKRSGAKNFKHFFKITSNGWQNFHFVNHYSYGCPSSQFCMQLINKKHSNLNMISRILGSYYHYSQSTERNILFLFYNENIEY